MLILMQAMDSEPYVIWLSGLHVPESYLTALVQATCRKNGWPLDKSTLYTSVTNYADPDDVTERIHQGNYTRWLVGVEFNAPLDTVQVISEAVFTANHLTDADKQNSTGKYR